jgi:hypothetical protein
MAKNQRGLGIQRLSLVRASKPHLEKWSEQKNIKSDWKMGTVLALEGEAPILLYFNRNLRTHFSSLNFLHDPFLECEGFRGPKPQVAVF